MTEAILFDYWRSSAAYRVRIALGLLEIDFRSVPVDLVRGEHSAAANLARNPQGLVPTLEIDGKRLTQSLAIIEYLDETRKAGLLPADPEARARVRALSYAIAMETAPVGNLSVRSYAAAHSGGAITAESWQVHFITRGLAGFERMLVNGAHGKYCHGDTVTMADICLIPQLYNADRVGIAPATFPQIAEIRARLDAVPAIAAAHPDRFRPAG